MLCVIEVRNLVLESRKMDIERQRSELISGLWRPLNQAVELHISSDLTKLHPETEALSILGPHSLEFLNGFSRLRYLYLMQPTAAQLASLPSLPHLQTLILRDTPEESLSFFSRCSELRVLSIWGASKLKTLPDLSPLENLETLALEHISKINSLQALSQLRNLKTLLIHSAVSWDAGGKRLEFDSFEPLVPLKHLEWLDLVGVRSSSGLAALEKMPQLKYLFMPEHYSAQQHGRLAASLPDTFGYCLKPFHTLPREYSCEKCQEAKVALSGKRSARSRNWICPSCNKKVLEEHSKAFIAGFNQRAGELGREPYRQS